MDLLLITGENTSTIEKFLPEYLPDLIRKVLADVGLEKVARVKTIDTFWEISLIPVINYLKQVLNLHFDVAFFPAQESALTWLREN